MTTYVPFDRDQAFLLPPDLKDWLPEDDIAHFIVAAVERVRLGAFRTNPQAGGKPQYHPRLMLGLLIYCYANGVFSSRRIERATYRDIGVRFIAANTHPDHDTIAVFRRTNKAAFEAVFLELLLLARETGLLKLGTVSIDGTKIDADASKIRSVRYDRAQVLRDKLAADIAVLTARAETADAEEEDPQALPREIARRAALQEKLDAACARLEAEAKARAQAERPEYERKKAVYQAKRGRRGRPPKPPEETPPPDRQSNLTDPDSALMRKSKAHEYRQAYNAQAVVCAKGSQLILAHQYGHHPERSADLRGDHPVDAKHHRPATARPCRRRLRRARGGGATGGRRGRAAGRDRQDPAAPALRLPPAAGRAKAAATHPRTLAPENEGQARHRCRQSPLQEAQTDRRTGLRHHQERDRVHPLPPERHPQRRHRMAARRSRL
jgi:transposase